MAHSSHVLLVIICMYIASTVSKFKIVTKPAGVYLKGDDDTEIGPLSPGDTILRKIVSIDKSEPLQLGKIVFKKVSQKAQIIRHRTDTLWQIVYSRCDMSGGERGPVKGDAMLQWLNQEPLSEYGQTRFGRLGYVNFVSSSGKAHEAKGEFLELLGDNKKRVWKGGDLTPMAADWKAKSIGKDFEPSGEMQQIGQAVCGMAHGIKQGVKGLVPAAVGKKSARMEQLNLEEKDEFEIALLPRLMRDRTNIQALKKRLLKRYFYNH
mmetsp:Transcript_29831/g.48569  ORF Transcript_29831/g.48569 Transcript_29831/m.48569 type:complete len:264 (-) Transcript_29831:35-826(-)